MTSVEFDTVISVGGVDILYYGPLLPHPHTTARRAAPWWSRTTRKNAEGSDPLTCFLKREHVRRVCTRLATFWAHDTHSTVGVAATCAACPLYAPHAPVFASSYGTLGKTASIAPGGSGCGGGEPSGRKMS